LEQWKRNTYILWLAVFVASIAWTMVMPFTPDYLVELGVDHAVEFWSGIIISASALCSMIMAPIWGAIGDRYGRRLMLLRSGAFLCLGYIGMALVTGPFGLLAVRMLIGALTGFVPMAIALVGVSTPQQHVGQALGLIQTAWPSGAIIGPVIGGVAADMVGIRASAYVSAAMITIVTILVFINVKEQFSPPAASKTSMLQDLKAAASHKVLLAIVLITTAANAAVMGLEPVLVPFVREIAGADAPSWLSGVLFSIPGVAFIGMAPYWAKRGAKDGYTRTITIGLLGSGLLYVAQTFVHSAWQMGAVRLLSGVSGAAIAPGVAALLATAIPRDLRGRAFGLNQSAASLGSIVGPTIAGYIGSFVDHRGVFLMTGLIYLIACVWTVKVVGPTVESVGQLEE
jgi:MFS transporter, DHA1 family, multidrug resistance protein